MTELVYAISLASGFLALGYLLIRFNNTRSYREIALFCLVAPVWILVYFYCGKSTSIRAFAESRVGGIVALFAACAMPVSASCFFAVIHLRRSAKAAALFSAFAALVLLGIGAFYSISGNSVSAASVVSFAVALAGLEAAVMSALLFFRRAREETPRPDFFLGIAFGTLGIIALAIGILSRAFPLFASEGRIAFCALFALFGIAAIRFSLPPAGKRGMVSAETEAESAGNAKYALKAENPDLLSNREMEIARLLITGKTYREIGEGLFIAPSTVKTHVLRIYEKTGVKNKVELANKLSRSDPAPLS